MREPRENWGKYPLGRWRKATRRFGRRRRSKLRRAWLRRLARAD